jgi:hypothetical protein
MYTSMSHRDERSYRDDDREQVLDHQIDKSCGARRIVRISNRQDRKMKRLSKWREWQLQQALRQEIGKLPPGLIPQMKRALRIALLRERRAGATKYKP